MYDVVGTEEAVGRGRKWLAPLPLPCYTGHTVKREEAAAKIFGADNDAPTNVVDVYVRYLREKIDERFKVKIITTVRGVGYTIKE